MNWAQTRKLQYISGVVLVLGIIAFLVLRSIFHEIPTCYDGKKNGDEKGVDCGGTCAVYCINELSNPKIRWARSFEVTPGIVHAVAYIEHSNPGAAARSVQYTFKIYDENNTLIAERSGTTYIGVMGQSAIVETRIPIGDAKPALTRLTFTAPIIWEKIPEDFSRAVIKTDRNILQNFSGGTRLGVTLDNQSQFSFTNMNAVAILYNADGNAITASQALIPQLGAKQSLVTNFTWPYFITDTISHTEFLTQFNPFTTTSK